MQFDAQGEELLGGPSHPSPVGSRGRPRSPVRCQGLLGQPDLPVRGHPEGPQMARLDPVRAQPCDQKADVQRGGVVVLYEPVALEVRQRLPVDSGALAQVRSGEGSQPALDRKSTRLNSSHEWISRMPSSA